MPYWLIYIDIKKTVQTKKKEQQQGKPHNTYCIKQLFTVEPFTFAVNQTKLLPWRHWWRLGPRSDSMIESSGKGTLISQWRKRTRWRSSESIPVQGDSKIFFSRWRLEEEMICDVAARYWLTHRPCAMTSRNGAPSRTLPQVSMLWCWCAFPLVRGRFFFPFYHRICCGLYEQWLLDGVKPRRNMLLVNGRWITLVHLWGRFCTMRLVRSPRHACTRCV